MVEYVILVKLLNKKLHTCHLTFELLVKMNGQKGSFNQVV